MKQPYPSIRLFKHPALEALTHVHPATPFILWIPILLYFYYQGFTAGIPASLYAGLILGGLFFWTITEYLMHRFVFHFPATNKVSKYLVFLFHGIHHDDPNDPTRLVMPPVVSITLSYFFFQGFKWALGEPYHFVFFGAFMSGYLVYDFIHFATHHFKPKTAWGMKIKENHMKHHFVDHDAKWGVSSPFWDYVFGTFKQPKK